MPKSLIPYKNNLKGISSNIWEHFTKIMVSREQKAKCMHCSAILKAKYQSGTSTLNRHVAFCFKKNQPKIEEALQGSLKVIKREDVTYGISYGSFDQNVLRSLIARMVIMHELPLRFMEYVGFREMMAHANPVVKPVSRNTLKSEILKLYQIKKVKTLHLLGKNHSRVAITTDLWIASH